MENLSSQHALLVAVHSKLDGHSLSLCNFQPKADNADTEVAEAIQAKTF